MTKTAELLACYRRIVFQGDENTRIRASKTAWKKRYEETQEELKRERKGRFEDNKDWDAYYAGLLKKFTDLSLKYADQQGQLLEVFDTFMELVGEINAQHALVDEMEKVWDKGRGLFGEDEPTPEVVVQAPAVMKATSADEEWTPSAPERCLSCGEDKGTSFFMCETCFDLSLDHNNELFYELVDAWRDGARDFPRPGKNAKELYKS